MTVNLVASENITECGLIRVIQRLS